MAAGRGSHPAAHGGRSSRGRSLAATPAARREPRAAALAAAADLGRRCHELRITDEDATWRIVYRIDGEANVIADVFAKKMQATPKAVIAACKRRLKSHDAIAGEKE